MASQRKAVAADVFVHCKDENNGLLCASPDEAIKGCEVFSKRLWKSSTYKKLSKEHPLEAQVVDRDALRQILRQHLDTAKSAEETFEQRGKFRRFSQGTTRFLSDFSAYLDAYGGIVEAVGVANGSCGEAAYKTLSMFLAVAVNKQNRDNKIGETLNQLSKQFSRFRLLEEIHSSPQLSSFLAAAYKLGIDFARYATCYYLRSGPGRLWCVIVEPPSAFEEVLAEIATAMQDVIDEGALLDSKRLHKVAQDLDGVQRTVLDMDNDIKEIQKSQWDAEVQRLCEKILPDYKLASQAVKEYQFRLNVEFDSHRQDAANRLSELQSSEAYRGWSHTERSSFLLLRGEATGLTHFCWFSPLVLRLYQNFYQASHVVAFHCCQVMDTNQKGDRFNDLLSHLIVQILQALPIALDPTVIRSIWNKLHDLRWGRDSSLAFDILVEILAAIKTVTLIIDRADLLRGDWEECVERICMLASSKVTKDCIVKILLVGSCITSDWRSLTGKMVNVLDDDQVFEINCAEEDRPKS